MKTILLSAALLAGAASAHAAIQSKTIEYQQGGATLQGVLVWDDAVSGPRPGVLVVHQWLGITEYEKHRATLLAQLGYVAFCADIYGQDARPKNVAEAGAAAGKYKANRALLRGRVTAGLEQLKQSGLADPKRLAAIGYCFGGTTVLELARSGAEIQGIVSFHGGLDSPAPADGRNIKCPVLVCHGADDPFEKPEDLAAFESEMREAKVDWRLIKYGGAVHSFTQPDPGFVNPGARYNEKADQRSWADMKLFFAEIFK